MTIELEDRPATDPKSNKGLNKYIEKDGDGWRGKIIAFNKDHTEAIIDGDSRIRLILIREIDPDQYPRVIRTINNVPKGWEIVNKTRKKKSYS